MHALASSGAVALTIVNSASAASRSPPVSLPQELIGGIVIPLYLGDIDIICLALTNAYFFWLLVVRAPEAIIRDEAPWAGGRLSLVSDCAWGVPENVMAEQGVAALLSDLGVPPDNDDGGENEDDSDHYWELDEEHGRARRNPLYAIGNGVNDRTVDDDDDDDDDAEEPEVHAPKRLQLAWKNRGCRIRRLRDRNLSGQEVARLDRLLMLPPSPHSGIQDNEYVPRNLTTKQYVRDAVLALSSYAYSLGDVICLYAMWIGEGSKGLWAGHRLDIADLHEVVGDGWEDVSKDAMTRLRGAELEKREDGKRP